MAYTLDDTLDERTRMVFKKMGALCNCGGPQYGTDHAPDCTWVLAWDNAREEAEDQLFQEKFPEGL